MQTTASGIVVVLPSQTEIIHMGSSSTENQDAHLTAGLSSQTESITYMDPSLYKAAAEGEIYVLNDYAKHLDLLLTPNKNTVLHIHITAQCGKMESMNFIEKILNMCPSLLLQANAKGETPLHIAARYGRCSTAIYLIERAKVLHEEELERGVGAARQMLKMTNKDKDTALHEAVRFNHIGVVQLLTREDPEFSYSANDACETPLYLAAERGFSDLVFEILQTCTSPAHGGPNGRTALHAGVICNDEGMTENILKLKGALAKEADQQGWTPLHYAAHLGHVSMVKLLLRYDKSVAYFADKNGQRTALHIAAGHGCSAIMKELILSCPDCCELVDKRGWNVLHFAIESDDDSAVKVVLENSWLINLLNEKDNDGNTPLHQLAASNFWISALVRHPRVDKMALNKENLSALDISLANKNFFEMKGLVIRDLRKAGARAGWRNITHKDDVGEIEERENNTINQLILKAKETHLIVATLIATVTFAAGFTLPGGYINDRGEDQGTAILARKTAFRVFVISDTIAMVLSSSSVFIQLILALLVDKIVFIWYFILASSLTITATGSMVVAFMTGLYAVLEHSSGIGIATCVIACSFFLLYYYLLAKPIGSRTRKVLKEVKSRGRKCSCGSSTYMATSNKSP